MRKFILFFICFAMLFICSCSKIPNYYFRLDDDVIRNNPGCFYNPECNHIVERKAITESDTKGVDPAVYHIVSCAFGNCDFENRYEKHRNFIIAGIASPQIITGGFYYHRIILKCAECGYGTGYGGGKIVRFRLCTSQSSECTGECLGLSVGKEYICDTQ